MNAECIPGADKISPADEPDPAGGIRLPLHRQRLLRPWRPHLPSIITESRRIKIDEVRVCYHINQH